MKDAEDKILSKKNFNTNTINNDEWLTLPELIESLGDFDLDPSSPISRPWDTALIHYNKNDDGLVQDWHGRVWLNPPYGRETFRWLKKLADHGDGIALVFARTETKGFHEQIWNRANGVFFFRGRINFYKANGEKSDDGANAPSCLAIYGVKNLEIVRKNLEGRGKLISLKDIENPPMLIATRALESIAASCHTDYKHDALIFDLADHALNDIKKCLTS